MGKIFISYRRADSEYVVGRIYSDLCAAYGKKNIFKDVDSIPLGVDFRDEIAKIVHDCDILIALIGEHWSTITDEAGTTRINDPDDYLRIEVEEALKRDIPVIPIITSNAKLPGEDDLPDSLKKLAFRNAIQVRPDPDYKSDFNRLKENIDRIYRKPISKRYFLAVIPLLIVAAAIFYAYKTFTSEHGAEPTPKPEPEVIVTAPSPTPVQPPAPAPPPKNLPVEQTPSFMIRQLTDADLAGKSRKQLDRMRNEIYARHGRRFNRSDLQTHFDQQPWYQPRYAPNEFPTSKLSEIQMNNVLFIRSYQQRMH